MEVALKQSIPFVVQAIPESHLTDSGWPRNLVITMTIYHCVKKDLRSKSPYSVQIRENTDQKNFVFGHFSRTAMRNRTLRKRYSSPQPFS